MYDVFYSPDSDSKGEPLGEFETQEEVRAAVAKDVARRTGISIKVVRKVQSGAPWRASPDVDVVKKVQAAIGRYRVTETPGPGYYDPFYYQPAYIAYVRDDRGDNDWRIQIGVELIDNELRCQLLHPYAKPLGEVSTEQEAQDLISEDVASRTGVDLDVVKKVHLALRDYKLNPVEDD